MFGGLRKLTLPNYRALMIAAVLAFVSSQLLVAGHQAQYGDEPHEHLGQTCVLSLAAPGGDKVVGASTFALTVLFAAWLIAPVLQQKAIVVVKRYSSGPRGPPSR